jgi:hypothetical protein
VDVETGHREKAVGRQDIPQHVTVAGLKYVQGQQCLGEKGQVGQGHDGDLIGYDYFHLHAAELSAIGRKFK